MSKIKKTILGLVGDTFLETAQVASVEVVSDHFRLIALQSPSFKKSPWQPGEKIQINVGEWNVRTYTPLSIDADKSELKILAYIHGNGPGSRWASQVKAGDACQFLGPRASLSLMPDSPSIFLFGDETSFAVASTFIRHLGEEANYHFIFEVSSHSESQKVCERLGILNHSTLITKDAADSHLHFVCQEIKNARYAVKKTQLFLTGNAKSIQYLRSLLRAESQPLLPMKAKAYWALGKEGID